MRAGRRNSPSPSNCSAPTTRGPALAGASWWRTWRIASSTRPRTACREPRRHAGRHEPGVSVEPGEAAGTEVREEVAGVVDRFAVRHELRPRHRARGWSSCACPGEQLCRAEPECLLRHVVEAVAREHQRELRGRREVRGRRGEVRVRRGDRTRVRRRTAPPCGTTTRAGRAPVATPARRRPGARRVRSGAARAHTPRRTARGR